MTQWTKMRKEISDYPMTGQQKKVRVAGKVVGLVCKGKKGQEFRSCRIEVLGCLFKKDDVKCSVEIESVKREVEESLKKQ